MSPQDEVYQRYIPPYNVILENDDYHSHTFVVSVLCKALGHSIERAYRLMLQAHQAGRAIVWTAPKEGRRAESRTDQHFREEPYGRLGCSIEPC